MEEEHILKQINLLNPKVKNKEVGDIEISEATTSDEINYNSLQFNNNFNNNNNNNGLFNNRVMINEEDNDVLNLWSQTNFFFDPVDPSKIDTVQQQQQQRQQQQQQQQSNINTKLMEVQNNDGGGGENNEILQMSERERDRQRYNKIKEKIYSHKAKHPKENNGNPAVIDKNALNKEDFLDFNGLQHLIDTNNSNKSDFRFDNNILNISSLNTNPNFSTVASSSSNSFSNNISSLNSPSNKPTKNKGGKSNLYTQILNSINNNTNIQTTKEINSSSILSKTNDSRSKEIADKKKRRSAATMRCREKKRNQFQKKEQYINYLKNHVLFLDGLISHMGNEINWLRKSYITQHGEQSLKEVYIENGLKNVDFNVFPGSVSLTSSSLLVNPLNQDPNLNPPSSTTLPFNPTNIIPTPSLPFGKNDEPSKLASLPLSVNSPSLVQPNTNPPSVLDLNINNTSFNQASLSNISTTTTTATKDILPTATPSIPPPTTNTTKAPDSSDNMSFLNGFLNLSKEQRDLLINFLKKQDQVQKPSTSNTSANIVDDTATSFSKPDALLSTLQNTTAATAASANQLSSLQQNLLNTLNQQSNLQSINFNTTSNVFTPSTTTIASTQPPTEGALSSTNLSNPTAPTTTSIQNLDKVVYYI